MKTFITRLKGVVNNDTLKKIGELRVKVSKMSNPTGENRVIILNTQKPLTITVNGDGYITDSTLSENKGKILSIPVGSSTFYVSNGDYTLSIPNKYYLTSFCSAKEQTFNRNDVQMELDDFKFCKLMTILKLNNSKVSGDIASLKDLSALASLNISNTQVSGDIASLKGLSALASLNISNLNNLSGDLGKLPDSLLYVGGVNNSIFTWTDTSRRYILACEKLHCNNIDKMLQDMSKLEAKFKNQWAKSINLVGSYTAASNAAIETLQSKGYTVSITPA